MIDYLIGTVEICTSEKRAINILAEKDIQCSHIRTDETYLSFRIPLIKYKIVKDILKSEQLEFRRGRIFGFPRVLYNYRKRWGFFAGVLLFFVLLFFSGRFIWSFDITGNCYVEDDVIIETLDNLGCGIGSKISDIDFEILHNRFLMECDDIAWISVNMDGTKAKVEVREVSRGSEQTADYNNVVASEDGQIELITVIDGKEQVTIGDIVKKGDLLISGVETYREGENIYYTSADGNVLATVNRVFTVEVPCETENKIPTNNSQIRESIVFFGFDINLFRNSGIPYEKYDIITENKQVVLFDSVELPIWIKKEQICEYKTETEELDETAAKAIAVKQYREKLAEMAEKAELVSIDTKHSFVDGIYKIECNLYCITDIAEKAPFTIVRESQEEDR